MTLQEQYNLIKEGKGAKDVFLKNAKSLFPNIIPNHFGFSEASTLLLQRGIIVENIINENLWGIATAKKGEPDWFKIFNEAKEYTTSTEEIDTKADINKPSKEVDEYKDKSYHNQYEAETGDDVIFDQYLRGIQVEACKSENMDKTIHEIRKMVLKNLKKDKLFYLKNAAFNTEGIGYTDEAPGLSKTKEVKGKYKSSGMEPVKLTESKSKIKAGDIIKHKLTGAKIKVKSIAGSNIEGTYVELGDMEGKVKKGDTIKTNVNLIGKTYELNESLDEIGMFHDPRTSASFKNDDDKWENGAFHVRFRMLKNKGIDEDKAKELATTYEDKSWEEVKKLLELNESKHSDEADLKIYKSELNMLNKTKPTGEKQLKRKAELEKKIDDLEKKLNESQLRSAIRSLIKEELNIKEIDQVGEEASKGAKTKKIDEEITKRKKKIKALETLRELEEDSVNEKKIKELYKEVKTLEKLKEKLHKKPKAKETIVDEVTVVDKNTTSDEITDIAKTEKTTPAAVKKAVDTAKSSGEPVSVA